MDYSILNQKEILKWAEPKTDLEVALYKIIYDGLEGCDELEERIESLMGELDDADEKYEDADHRLVQAQDLARKAMDLIGHQNLFNRKEVIDCLKEIIDV